MVFGRRMVLVEPAPNRIEVVEHQAALVESERAGEMREDKPYATVAPFDVDLVCTLIPLTQII